MRIKIIATGDPTVIWLEEFLSRLKIGYYIERLFTKDSLEINSQDREMIKRFCEGPTCGEKILVTHGTDTMIDTARVLSEVTNKTIVLTGSTNPHHRRKSDVEFSIAVAIGALIVLGNGVYIAKNRHVYPWDQDQKLQNSVLVENSPVYNY